MVTATSSLQCKERMYLALKEKVEVIRKSDTNPMMTLRDLGKCVSCGKTQISGILKTKEDILAVYEVKRSDMYSSVDKKGVSKWYFLATLKTFILMDHSSVKS